MRTETDLRLRVWDATAGAPAEVPLPIGDTGSCTVALRCLPGATGIHFVLSDRDDVRLRGEVEAVPGEVLRLQVDVEGGELHVSSQSNVILLPADDRYEAALPIQPDGKTRIDVAVVIDGTLRAWDDTQEKARPRLLEREKAWSAYTEELVAFLTTIVEGRDWQAAVLAFGDQNPPAVMATDLQPRYLLYPNEKEVVLRPQSLAAIRETLRSLPPSSGADFVDALADALAACNRLRWREDTRRIVIVCGDSPGFSLLNPLPKEADLSVRAYDVDTQAVLLHGRGVEIVTIYHAPPPEKIGPRSELIEETRKQYVRLASLRQFAFDAATFETNEAAEQVRTVTGPIGRGAALGEWASASSIRRPAEVQEPHEAAR